MRRRLAEIREDFPILSTTVRGKPLVYLDSAATTQMPLQVQAAVEAHYRHDHANIHRGIHTLSQRSTARVEEVRGRVARFLGAAEPEEIIFTGGTTGGINLVAAALGAAGLGPGDEILVTALEHHSNFVPWQQLCRRTGAAFRVVPLTKEGDVDMAAMKEMISPRTRLVAAAYVSNVTGSVTPIPQVVRLAHAAGALVLVDGAQSMRHGPIRVDQLDCDFLVFSGHKLLAPTGVGVLYGRRAVLEALPPPIFGGGMVDEVTAGETTFAPLPFKFEAGTPHIAGIIGLGAAIDYLSALDPAAVARYELQLLIQANQGLLALPEVELVGRPVHRAGAITFNIRGAHCFDVAALLDGLGVAVRSGHHCAQPLFRSFGLEGGVRLSPAFYNTPEEIDAFLNALERIIPVLKKR